MSVLFPFSPAQRLLSTSYDDTIRIWSDPAAAAASDGSHFAQALSLPHNNQTGRWITPFRCVGAQCWDSRLHVVVGAGRGVRSRPDQSCPPCQRARPAKLDTKRFYT